MYELIVLLRIGDDVHTIDTIWSKSLSDLEAIAKERKANNPNYQTIIIAYSAISANIF